MKNIYYYYDLYKILVLQIFFTLQFAMKQLNEVQEHRYN